MASFRRLPSRLLAAALSALLGVCILSACGEHPVPPMTTPPPEVLVSIAVQREVEDFDEFTARLEAPDRVEVRARVAGALEKVHFVEGQHVRKGDLLFTIDPRRFSAEVARIEAQRASGLTQAELADSELARAEQLLPIEGVSRLEVDQLRAAVRNARSSVQASDAALKQAQLNLEFASIRAPISGRISRALVTAGNLVAVGEPVLTTIVSSDLVHAYFDVSEAAFLRHMQGARASRAPAWMALANEDGFPHEGRLDFVDNRLNPATATIRGRALFENAHGRFTPGLFARVRLAGSARYLATLVPDRAITTDQTRKVVLTVGDDNIVLPREVKPGALVDGMRVVQGIRPGERVVVEGLHRAVPGALVSPRMPDVEPNGLPGKVPTHSAHVLGR